jgi:hypothetical protein
MAPWQAVFLAHYHHELWVFFLLLLVQATSYIEHKKNDLCDQEGFKNIFSRVMHLTKGQFYRSTQIMDQKTCKASNVEYTEEGKQHWIDAYKCILTR